MEKGTWLTLTSFMKIISLDGNTIRVVNEKGLEYSLGNQIVEKETFDYHSGGKDIPISKKQMLQLIRYEIQGQIFKCCFLTKPGSNQAEAQTYLDGKSKEDIKVKELFKIFEGAERNYIC